MNTTSHTAIQLDLFASSTKDLIRTNEAFFQNSVLLHDTVPNHKKTKEEKVLYRASFDSPLGTISLEFVSFCPPHCSVLVNCHGTPVSVTGYRGLEASRDLVLSLSELRIEAETIARGFLVGSFELSQDEDLEFEEENLFDEE